MSQKISIYGGIAWNKGELGHFADLIRGRLTEKEGVVFLRGGLIPQYTLWD